MATVTKDFRIKSGLVVEGATAKVNNFDILTKKEADEAYIVGLVTGGGGSSTENTPNTVVLRDGSGNFAAGEITAGLLGNVTGTVSDISNHSTDNLAEGANLYFTNQRAVNATAASYDPTGSAAAAQQSAQAFATAADADLLGVVTSDIATAKSEAISDAAFDATTKANAAEAASKLYTDGRESAITTAYRAYADAAEADAKIHADQQIAALVDGAPETLDTLNELAAALQDNPDVIADLQAVASGKQNTLTPGANISILEDTISVTGLDTDDVAEGTNLYFTDARALSATALAYDVAGSASAAEAAAAIDATSKANAAQSAAESFATTSIDALDTDDIEEGASNLYFTDERAQDAVAAAIAAGTHENIVITYSDVDNSISFVAENGVLDSTTTDLAEGTNLYFTNARAVTALEAVVPNFTEVDLNAVATQVAATSTVATASQATAYTFDSAAYRSAKFLVKVAYGTHTEVSEVLLTLDTSDNIAITEYAIVGTNGSASTVSAGINGTDVQLLVTTTNDNSTVTVMGTLLV